MRHTFKPVRINFYKSVQLGANHLFAVCILLHSLSFTDSQWQLKLLTQLQNVIE